MRRVLLVQPSLQPPGGGNGVAVWMLQALVQDHRVTVLSWRPVDVGPINRFFGTTLRASDFDNIVLPRTWTLVPDWLPVPAALLRNALLMRYTRRISDAFDVLLAVHNETDFGRRGIQYVHYPTYLRPRPQVDYRWYHRATPLLTAYYRITDRIADFSFERLRQNLTLANSDWTAARVKELLGIDARTLYPPAVDPAPPRAWRERAPCFVALGRISPEKEYERAIRILDRVHRRLPDLTLTIVGTWDRHTRRYTQELQRLAASLGSWVQFRRDLSRKELRELLAGSRYGIHAMREEHFGMAPAEMVRAGMIVWLPRGGGQVEIVGDEPALLYESEDEAADKILRTMSDDRVQEQLREYLESRSALFSTERFVNEVRSLVANFEE